MDNIVTLSSDPFARTTLERRVVDTTATCSWCGRKRPSGRLFEYGTAKDGSNGGRVNWHKGLFDSKSCHDSYHG